MYKFMIDLWYLLDETNVYLNYIDIHTAVVTMIIKYYDHIKLYFSSISPFHIISRHILFFHYTLLQIIHYHARYSKIT